MILIKKWVNHLKQNHMTYCEHWKFAAGHGFICLEAGLLLIIHGFFPCFFEHAGSTLVRKLKLSFDQHRKEIKDCAKNVDQL
jgi:hypothetical protein